MKCLYCNAEIINGAKFCTACGREQKQIAPPMGSVSRFCTKCGAQLKPEEKFCKNCGTPVMGNPMGANQGSQIGRTVVMPMERPMARPVEKSNGKKTAEIIAIFLVVLLLVGAVAAGAILISHNQQKSNTRVEDRNKDRDEDDKDKKEDEKDNAEATEAASEETVATTEVDLSKVDINLTENDWLEVDGNVLDSLSEGKVIKLGAPQTVYGPNELGENLLVENVTSLIIDERNLPNGLVDSLSDNLAVKAEGTVFIEKGMVYMLVDTLKNRKGKDLAQAFREDDDYIIPESSDVYLTENDIKNLSLRELNYAKNEIYARHGRRFDSKELRDYFGSKDWYRGTIDPSDFNENVLSKIERANVILLRDREFSIDPKGYQLY